MIQPDKNKPCVILGELCTWCGRKNGEIALCKITIKGFNILPRIKAVSSISTPYNYECFFCGNVYRTNSKWMKSKTRDHLIPKSTTKSGTQHIQVDCCRRCNQLKGKLMPRSFLLAPNNGIDREQRKIVRHKLHQMGIYV